MSRKRLGITFHRNPADRRWYEKVLRRFILNPYPHYNYRRWSENEARLKRNFPIRYFIHETLSDKFHEYVVTPFNTAKRYIRYRTSSRYHVVNTTLEPGYHDADTRMLYSSFQLLQDYVEIELASIMDAVDDTEEDTTGTLIFDRIKPLKEFFKRKKIRRPERGLQYLDNEISEDRTITYNYMGNRSQSELARVKKELYLWWTVYRKEREDPYSTKLIWNEAKPRPRSAQYSKEAYDKAGALEQFYEEEDDEMFALLVSVRKSLWT